MKNILKICFIALIAFYSCDDPYEKTTYQVYDVNPVSTYLDTRSDEFSEWVKILKYADLYNAVNQASEQFTVFVPNNDAVKAFYKKKGVSSIEDLGKDYARDLGKYHIIADTINDAMFVEGGKLDKMTLSDDYLSVTYDVETGGGLKSLYVNKEAHVEEIAIRVSNGFVYVLGSVLNPLIETVYERIGEAGKYNIFKEAISKTSWSDSLSVIYRDIKQPNGSVITQKQNYTVLAVTDEVFSKAGISSFDNLVAKLGAESDYTNPENELFRYVAFHIIKGNYSLFELNSFDGDQKKKIWEPMTDIVMIISKEADENIYINYAGGIERRARFVENTSDVQARNGMLHELDAYLPAWQSETPETIYFDFCNYPEVAAYIKSYGTTGQLYQTEHATAEYRTAVTNLSCYQAELGPSGTATPTSSFNYVDYFTAKSSSNWKNSLYKDQIILNLGYMGHVSMKTPVLIAGKYKVTLYFAYATSMDFMRKMTDGSNGGSMQFSFDGDHTQILAPYPTISANTLNVYNTVLYNELEFTKTAAHTLKIVIMDPAASTNSKFRILLDYLLFEPIINE